MTTLVRALFLLPFLLVAPAAGQEDGAPAFLSPRILRIRPGSDVPGDYSSRVASLVKESGFDHLAWVLTPDEILAREEDSLHPLSKALTAACLEREVAPLVLVDCESGSGTRSDEIARSLPRLARMAADLGAGAGLRLRGRPGEEEEVALVQALVSAFVADTERPLLVDGWSWSREALDRALSGDESKRRVLVSVPFAGRRAFASADPRGVDPSFLSGTEPETFRLLFLLENGDSLVLPWSDPDLVRNIARAIRRSGGSGLVLGALGPDFSGRSVFIGEETARRRELYDFERRWILYHTVGRFSRDPDLEDAAMVTELTTRYGKYAADLFTSLLNSSRIFRLVEAVHPETSSETYYVVGSVSSYEVATTDHLGDERPHRGILDTLLHAPSPGVASCLDVAAIDVERRRAADISPKRTRENIIDADRLPDGRRTPMAVFREIAVLGGVARNLSEPLVHEPDGKKTHPAEMRAFARDLFTLSNLALFHGSKIRSAQDLALALAGGDRRHARTAGVFAHQCVAWWKYTTWETTSVYEPFVVGDPHELLFHWDRYMMEIVATEEAIKDSLRPDPVGFALAARYLCAGRGERGPDLSLAKGLLDIGMDPLSARTEVLAAAPLRLAAGQLTGRWGLLPLRGESGEAPVRTSAGREEAVLVCRLLLEGEGPIRLWARGRRSGEARLLVRLVPEFLDPSPAPSVSLGLAPVELTWTEASAPLVLPPGHRVLEIAQEGPGLIELASLYLTRDGSSPPAEPR